ncbi:unnamed protein product [Caenorhabditis auriculariae]|uniref:Uncharacterized protein n=1 Tax=Caenorhabditis auriculariae TaxID=2777116 RepID=A0A8S1H9V2_9PELO|nr:unnamed protein product [Caenorhabditis auriculariae]
MNKDQKQLLEMELDNPVDDDLQKAQAAADELEARERSLVANNIETRELPSDPVMPVHGRQEAGPPAEFFVIAELEGESGLVANYIETRGFPNDPVMPVNGRQEAGPLAQFAEIAELEGERNRVGNEPSRYLALYPLIPTAPGIGQQEEAIPAQFARAAEFPEHQRVSKLWRVLDYRKC